MLIGNGRLYARREEDHCHLLQTILSRFLLPVVLSPRHLFNETEEWRILRGGPPERFLWEPAEFRQRGKNTTFKLLLQLTECLLRVFQRIISVLIVTGGQNDRDRVWTTVSNSDWNIDKTTRKQVDGSRIDNGYAMPCLTSTENDLGENESQVNEAW